MVKVSKPLVYKFQRFSSKFGKILDQILNIMVDYFYEFGRNLKNVGRNVREFSQNFKGFGQNFQNFMSIY